MKKMHQSLPLLAALMGLASLEPLSAAVNLLGSHTKTTDGDETFSAVFGGGSQFFNYTSGNVYVVMNVTFTNPTNPGVLDTTSSYGGYSHSSGDLFGQNWEQSTVGVTYYGGWNDIAGVAITPGTPITLVIKYELNGEGLDGDTVKFWVNPALGTGTEGSPNLYDSGWIWTPAAITSDDLRFRRGNDSENHIEFSNVTIYDGGDSPFALIPEPSGALLGGLGLLSFLYRRRG